MSKITIIERIDPDTFQPILSVTIDFSVELLGEIGGRCQMDIEQTFVDVVASDIFKALKNYRKV